MMLPTKTQLTEEQQEKLRAWLQENWLRPGEGGRAHGDAAVGCSEVTLKFTECSIGTIVVAESFGKEIDLTEYEKW